MERFFQRNFWESLPFVLALIVQGLCFLSQEYRRDLWNVITIPDDERLHGLLLYLAIFAVLGLSSLLIRITRMLSARPNAKYLIAQQTAYASCAVILALLTFLAIGLTPMFLELDSDGESENAQRNSP